MSTQKLASLLVRHEGLKLKPYRCPAGKLTIGVGRNIEDRGITKHEAMMMLDTDMALSNEDLLAVIGYETMSRLNEPRHAVLVSMVFNIGKTRFSRFKKMIAAVQASDWMRVSLEMQNSLWAKQVGQRAEDLCWMMRNGRWMDQEESAACEHCAKGQPRFQEYKDGPYVHYNHPTDKRFCTASNVVECAEHTSDAPTNALADEREYVRRLEAACCMKGACFANVVHPKNLKIRTKSK